MHWTDRGELLVQCVWVSHFSTLLLLLLLKRSKENKRVQFFFKSYLIKKKKLKWKVTDSRFVYIYSFKERTGEQSQAAVSPSIL